MGFWQGIEYLEEDFFLCGSLPAISSFIGICVVGGHSILGKSSEDSGEIQCAGFGGGKGSRLSFSLFSVVFCMVEVCEAKKLE